jgi:hypothetical protein
MTDWEIRKPLGQCTGTGRKIEHNEEYFAALVQTDQGLQRQDFSADYWHQHKPQVYCYWKSRLPEPGRKKQLFVDDQMLLAFFERLAQETDQEKISFRFVLALVLMRKRRLKYDSSRTENDREIWRLRIVGSDNEYTEVLNPSLGEAQIEQLSSQVGQILQVELL